MLTVNYSEFRANIKEYFSEVENKNQTLLINRKKGKGTVLMSLKDYNSITETLHIISSRRNTLRLFDSIEQMKHP